MSTRLRDITTESDLARVPTRDLDPDPSNGLKNENRENQQRGEIQSQGPVRQQPITVSMANQQGQGGIRDLFNQRVVTPLQQFLFNQGDEEDPFQTQEIVTRPGSSQPTQGFNTASQFNPLDAVPEAAPGVQFRSIDPSLSLPEQEPREFTVEQTGFTSEADIIQDPFTGRMQSQTQVTPVDRGVLTEGQEAALETIGLVGVPGVGRAGQAVNTRALRFPERVRGLPIRAERAGQQLGQRFAQAIPQGPMGNRGTLQLGELAARGQQAGQRAQQTLRGGDILPSPGQVRPNPGQIINRPPLGSGGQPFGANRLQLARELDVGLQSLARQQRAFTGFADAQPSFTGLDLLRQAQQPQVTQQDTLQRPITVPQANQLGGVSPLDQITVGNQIQRVEQSQQPTTMFPEQLPVPSFNRLLTRPRPGVGQGQFGGQRQFPGQQRLTVQSRFPGQQGQLSGIGQRQPPATVQRGDQQFPPINPTFPDPTPRTPPRTTPRVPGRPPRIPGIPPVPFGFGGGGGGAGGAGTRRRFPFGRVRQFSPAFPGTSFRVLPDGSVVLDLDPGERTGRTSGQPRDPNTGQFLSRGG